MISKTSQAVLGTFISQILLSLLAFVGAVVVARVLGPEGKGEVSFLILIPMLTVTLGSFGVQEANIYFISKRQHSLQDSLIISFVLALFFGFISSLIVWTGLLLFDFTRFSNISGNMIAGVVFLSPILFMSRYADGLIIGLNDFITYNRLRVLQPFLYLTGIIILVLVKVLSAQSAIAIWYASLAMSIVITLVVILSKKPKAAKPPKAFHFNLGRTLETIRYGTPVHLGDMSQFLIYRLDQLFVAFFLGAKGLGLYSVSVNCAEVITYFPVALGTVLFPVAASLKTEQADMLTSRMCRIGGLATTIIAVVSFLIITPIIGLVFGNAFLPSSRAFQLLLPGIVAMGIARIASKALAAKNKQIITAYAGGITILISIVLNVVLIPLYGINGASIGSTVAYIIYSCIVLRGLMVNSSCTVSSILKPNISDVSSILSMKSILAREKPVLELSPGKQSR